MQSTLNNIFQPSQYNRKQVSIGILMGISLIAFELFNFDTTQFALTSLLGEVTFANIKWASILAVAFCAIDFAGLARFFTPESNWSDEPREIWFLTAAWFLGATMNAVMTWWAISLTLLNHDFGNEVLSREELLRIVPIFVAVLVWLTRILFIGGLSMAGDRLLNGGQPKAKKRTSKPRTATKAKPKTGSRAKKLPAKPRTYTPKRTAKPQPKRVAQPAPPAVTFLDELDEDDDIWEDEYDESVVQQMPASRPHTSKPYNPSIAPPRASAPAPKRPRPIQNRATYNKPKPAPTVVKPAPTARRKMPARPNGGRPNMPPIQNRKKYRS